VTASAGERGGKPYIAVEDTGPGIPENERERVRQRFYRLPNSSGHGSGLGLAIVEEIAKLYEAAMSIGPGRNGLGTKVSVEFPASSCVRAKT
jgi:signal transduction histidine kinase